MSVEKLEQSESGEGSHAFTFSGFDASGNQIQGEITASSEADARQRLATQGYRLHSVVYNRQIVAPLQYDLTQRLPAGNPQESVQAAQASATARASITLSGTAAKTAPRHTVRKAQTVPRIRTAPAVGPPVSLLSASPRDIMFFVRQLSNLTHSGISIYDALERMSQRTSNKNLAKTAAEMAAHARNGGRISDVMARYPLLYPAHVVGTVRAGETGGFLDIALGEVATTLEQNIALFRGAFISKFLATQGLFGLLIAIPAVDSLFATMDLATNVRILLVRECIAVPVGFVIWALIWYGGQVLRRPNHQLLRDRLALRVPAFGDLHRQAGLSAFIRMLRRLYQAGVSPAEAWECAMNTADNQVIRDKLSESYNMVVKGASLPDALMHTGLFASNVEQLIATGYDSGQMVESLDQAADFYQGQVDDATRRARFMLFRFGILAAIILVGIGGCWMAYRYGQNLFSFVDRNFGD